MKTLMIAASAAVLSLAAVPAIAQAQEFYGTAGYAGVDANDSNLGAIQGRVGYKFNPYVGVEGELAFGISDDSGVELKNALGAYGVVYAPITPEAQLFARAGYTGASYDTPLGEADTDGFAYGVGGQYYFTAKDGVRVDWTKHDHDDVEADVWSVGYTRKF